ncbi:MAG: hypothetical protein CVT86_07530, partial [Alphaproteobacteria bacterium HGW-Alphaproteobacteria-8]
MQVITYSENGSPRVVYPAPEYPGTIDDLAALVVPPGLPWQAVDHTELPAPDPAELLAAERAQMVASRFQARQALRDAGLLATVEAAVAATGGLAQSAWDEAIEFRRTSPTIAALAVALG